MIGSRIEYIKAYTELNCLLKYFPKEYIKKLPIKLLDLIDRNSADEFKIKIDYNNSLNSLNLSEKTYNLLSVLKYNYWSTDQEKESIEKKLNENEKEFEKKLREKYNIENLFKNRTKDNVIEEKLDLSLIEYKETVFNKIINLIKRFFKCK